MLCIDKLCNVYERLGIMKKVFLIAICLLLAICLIGCEEEETISNVSETNGKIYTYVGEGFGGDFTIQINDDGSAIFYEGYLSSHMGVGNWTMENDILTVSDGTFTNRFKVNGNELDFIEEGSTNFLFIKLKSGDKFVM